MYKYKCELTKKNRQAKLISAKESQSAKAYHLR